MSYFGLCNDLNIPGPIQIILGALLAFCSLLGVLLNGHILITQLKRSRSNWGVQLISTALTSVDLTVCACFGPWLCLHTVWFWAIDHVWEDTMHAIAATLCVASSLVLTLYSYERYLIVINYGKTSLSRKKCHIIAALLTGIAVAVFAGASFAIDVTDPAPSLGVLILCLFTCPVGMLYVLYIANRLKYEIRSDSENGYNSRFIKIQVRLSKIALFVAMLSFTLWLPYVGMVATLTVYEQHVELLTCHLHIGINIALAIGVTSAALRPVVFMATDKELRNGALNTFLNRTRVHAR